METVLQAINQLAFEVSGLARGDRADVMQIALRELRPLLNQLSVAERYQAVERMAEIIAPR